MYFVAEVEELPDGEKGLMLSSLWSSPGVSTEEEVAKLADSYPDGIYFEAELTPPMGDLIDTVIRMSTLGVEDIRYIVGVLAKGSLDNG